MDGLPDPVKANTRIRIYLSKRARGKLFKKESQSGQSGPFQPTPHRFHLFSFCPNPAYHVPSPEFFSNSILPRPSPSRTNCLHSQISASASIILVAFRCGMSSGKTGVQLRVFSYSKGSGAGRSSQIRTAQGWEPGSQEGLPFPRESLGAAKSARHKVGNRVPRKMFPSKVPRKRFPSKVPRKRFPSKVPNGSQEVPRNRFPSKGSQARFPGTGSRGSQQGYQEQIPKQGFPARGSQAGFPGRGYQEEGFQEEVPRQGPQEVPSKVPRIPSKGSQEEVPKQG